MAAREQELNALLERRTGVGVPTLAQALTDEPEPYPASSSSRAPAVRTGAARGRAPGAGA